jgi:hypothetical protein
MCRYTGGGGTDQYHQEHSSLFRDVQVHHLGPALAFNLIRSNQEVGKWGEMINTHIRNFTKVNRRKIVAVMLAFGEIDIRTQVVMRAHQMAISLDESVSLITLRLMKYAALLSKISKVPIIIWEPVPTSGNKNFSYNPDFPAIGTEVERNYSTLVWRDQARLESWKQRNEGLPIYSFGIAEKLLNFGETNPAFYCDGCHLDLTGLRIAVDAFHELCEREGLTSLSHFFTEPDFVKNESRIRNISSFVKLTLSSTYNQPNSLKASGRGYCFHTDLEENPYALIDIGYGAILDRLVIYNRFESFHERTFPLQILCGLDLSKLDVIAIIDHSWGLDGIPLMFKFGGYNQYAKPVRYLLLRLGKKQFFHLGEVQIFEKSFLNQAYDNTQQL